MNFNNKQIKSFIKILKEKLILINEILINYSADIIFV